MAHLERARVELDVTAGEAPQRLVPRPETPFRIVVVGDFAGGGRSGFSPPQRVDRDDLDAVLARVAPRLRLELGDGEALDLAFREMEDFHPDRIVAENPFFRALMDARARLMRSDRPADLLREIAGATPGSEDPAAEAGAEERPGGAAGAAPAPDETGGSPPGRPEPDVEGMVSGSLLDRIVDEGSGSPDRPAGSPMEAGSGDGAARGRSVDPLQAFLRRVVAPHLVPDRDPRQGALLADLDAAIAEGLRALLHHPAFQALEARWRAVELLVRRLETGPLLQVQLLPVTRAALVGDALGGGDPGRTALARALRDPADGMGPAVVLVDLFFDAAPEDLELLVSLARTARSLGAALVAGAAPGLVGLGSSAAAPGPGEVRPLREEAWGAFRRAPEARSVGLALPRVLLRSPYGAEGEPLERLDFEEVGAPPRHDRLLWGNPAFACALLLGEAFAASGWRMSARERLDVPGLPVHVWRSPDGPGLVACTEWRAGDEVAAALMEEGLMVLAPGGHGETARLLRFQSVATPPTGLAGPWAGV